MADTSAKPLPRTKTIRVPLAAVATASELSTIIGTFGFDTGLITQVNYYPVSDIVGADTNSRGLQLLICNPATGAVVETITLKQFLAAYGTATANKKNDVLTGATAAVAATLAAALAAVTSGQVLRILSHHIGTGLADPGGMIEIVTTNGSSV